MAVSWASSGPCPHSDPHPGAQAELLRRLRPEEPAPLWLATLLFAIGMEAVFTFTRTYVGDRGVGTTGIFFAAYGLIAAVTRIIGGRL